MKNRLFVALLLSTALALPAVAQQASSTSAQPAALRRSPTAVGDYA